MKSIGKKSFQCLADTANISPSTVSRKMPEAKNNFNFLKELAPLFFKKKEKLIIVLDDTLIKKIHSKEMCGSGYFYDTQARRSILE